MSSVSPFNGIIVSVHVYVSRQFYEKEWTIYTLEKTKTENVKGFFHSFEYTVKGVHKLEIDKTEWQKNCWVEFGLKKPIKIKKNEYLGISTEDLSDSFFSYYLGENDPSIRKSFYDTLGSVPNLNDTICLLEDKSQICFYYTLQIDYENWSESAHHSYPYFFTDVVPLLLYYLKKKFNLPRVLIYHIFRKF